ncbi:MAG: energy-coupling factor transporter ATPase [Clostridia bacterium]|nr:energy-coupling factor transporter ATPase [Clostridia bacterium]
MPVVIKNLTHIYAPGTPFEKKALDNITLSIQDGEFVGLIGHTGSGKSTLIQHINALMQPTSGKVIVNGIDTSAPKSGLEIRKSVGLVFQYPEYQLFEETIEKDVAFGPRNLGLDEEEIKKRVSHALDLVGIDEALYTNSPFDLSGGQKRRVAIAGVLAMKPQILILDEPSAGLDPAGRADMRKLIKDIKNEGVTVVMVSHSMDDVSKMCDRIIVMNKGTIALDGTPREVFKHTELIESIHLGVPAASKLRERLNRNGLNLSEDIYTIEDMKTAILENLQRR